VLSVSNRKTTVVLVPQQYSGGHYSSNSTSTANTSTAATSTTVGLQRISNKADALS
jgi:hypothetical protein